MSNKLRHGREHQQVRGENEHFARLIVRDHPGSKKPHVTKVEDARGRALGRRRFKRLRSRQERHRTTVTVEE